MNQLDSDIQYLQDSLTAWHSLYDKKALARAKRMLNYMRELKKLREIRKEI